MTGSDVLLRVRDLVVDHRAPGGTTLRAVDGISFTIRRGETLGLVGESGCGKSSTAQAVLMLRRPTGGRVEFDGQDLARLSPRPLRRLRPRLQLVFQDAASSLNPRRTAAAIVAEGLAAHRFPRPWDRLVDDALSSVGLDPRTIGHRRPGELSGGQCQRVALARALVLSPALVVCDEPVSALDVSVQAQILNLLEDVRRQHGLSLLFIAHDLAVVRQISDRVGVMYRGRLCELAPAERLYRRPRHPYTRTLLDAVPRLDGGPGPAAQAGRADPGGSGSSPRPPRGCRFRSRCPQAQDRCAEVVPLLRPVAADHQVACHFPD
ncbi:ABC transporter ATP-binding protein [Frankia sp. AgPm24]|uniref:oligopeptide/dipeptide ABC transporter ATP-binding protein n=1 Tax=Frankia sp. AgPm24 TaxID=631128 RepID=UPI00200CA9DE|nr:ABC transporter ATP-binding protein [Frankia sp. AgPm24]MCK9922406.1 ABC transporter ATP-binding protein [Frankia sp. AgPm24]